jgi:phospholipase/carboxylesterase
MLPGDAEPENTKESWMTDLPLMALERAAEPAPGRQPWLLVLMHGVGSNELDLFGLAPYVPPQFHVLSLRAPFAMGPTSHAWFQFTVDADGTRHIHVAQEERSRALVAQTVETASRKLGIAPERVVAGGFSQGGIMALSLLLTRPQSLRAAMVMHGRLLPEALPQQAPATAFEGKSLWISHGVHDNVIPLTSAQALRDHARQLPLQVDYHEFPGVHEIRPAELQAAMGWLERLSEAG